MKGIGILVNVLAALVGGGFGVMLRGKLKVQYQRLIYRLMGLVIMAVGAYEFIQHYFVLDGGEIELTGSMLVILALILGGLMGYLFDINGSIGKIGRSLSQKDEKNQASERARMERLSRAVDVAVEKNMSLPKVGWLDRLSTYEMPAPLSDNLYADGFLLSVVLLCASPMLFNGVVADAQSGETTVLLIKSLIDFILCFFFGMFFGSGVMYAVIPMVLIDAVIYALYIIFPNFTAEFFTPTLTAQISVIGAVILLFLGIQMAFDRKKPKAASLLPAYIIPLLYYGILFVVNLFIGD